MMPQQDTPPPLRRRLSRALVAREAITLADQDGLGALSMRSLATRLGVVPMALYKHVADKSDLIDRMVDVIVESYSEPKHSASWRQKVRARALSAREAILAHPWLGQAIDTRTKRSETVLAHMNAVAGDFIEGGVSPDLTHYAMHTLGNRIWGYSPEAFADVDAPTAADAHTPEIYAYMSNRFPYVVAIAMDAASRSPSHSCEQQSEFEFTLDLILEAVERLHLANWVSRPIEA